MSISNLLGSFGKDKEEERTATEKPTHRIPESVGAFFEGDPPAAYDRDRERKFKFVENFSISTTEGEEHATITISTLTQDVSFDVRVKGYTSRFGTLDAGFISIGGYAVEVYYKIDSDTYLVRRCFYYGDADGIGGENTREQEGEPYNFDWSANDFGQTVTGEREGTRLSIYDWRENMITSGKHTPSKGEIVLQYQSSLQTGGNRDGNEIVLDSNVNTVTGEKIRIDLLKVDHEDSTVVGYGSDKTGDWWEIRVPITHRPEPSQISIERASEPNPNSMENLVWARSNSDSWAVNYRTKSY